MRRFEKERYLAAIQRYSISESPMVPPMISSLIKEPEVAATMLQSLKLVWSAGAPLSQALQEDFCRILDPSARVIQVWGMTEAGWISTFQHPERDDSGSVGRLLPGMEVK